MSVKITADLSAFRASLRKVMAVTKKEEADIVNKALKDVAFRAASFTPKSSPGKIGGIPKQMLARIAARSLEKKGGTAIDTAGLKERSAAAKQRKYTKAALKIEMLKIIQARKNRIGALRAGWIPAIQAMGGTYRGATRKQTSSAAKGGASKADAIKLSGKIVNTIETRSHTGKHSADQISVAVNALAKAVAFVTRDRNEYAQRKIDALLRANSD